MEDFLNTKHGLEEVEREMRESKFPLQVCCSWRATKGKKEHFVLTLLTLFGACLLCFVLLDRDQLFLNWKLLCAENMTKRWILALNWYRPKRPLFVFYGEKTLTPPGQVGDWYCFGSGASESLDRSGGSFA